MPEAPNPRLRSAFPAPTEPARSPSHLPYAELGITTNFSFLRGSSHPDELVYTAANLGYSAVGVCDLNTVGGVVRAHEAAKKCGLPFLVGARLRLVDSPDILVWPSDRAAYGRLCTLLTVGRRAAPKGECELCLNDLADHATGLFAAVVPPDPRKTDPTRVLELVKDIFGPQLSITLCCEFDGVDRRRVERLRQLSTSIGIPLLATNDVRYHDKSRRPLHDVITCIRYNCNLNDAGYRLRPNAERYLKSPEQMHKLFAEHPAAIRRGLEIVAQCGFSLDELQYEYPDEVIPKGMKPIEHVAALAAEGAKERYRDGVPKKVQDQIAHELQLIESLKFEPYFLTVHDIVKYARGRGILYQGRGSAANSAVCYCLGVTSVNPAQIDVLFERFISGARGEPPDIDIDFEHERREEVIQYVYEKYGRHRAGMTGTLITYRGRSAVRDVGKALGLSLDVVEQVANRLDWWHSGTLSDADLTAAGLSAHDHTVRLLVQRTSEILGFPRHLSQHVGGMVMTRGPLCELVPIENASMADRTVIQWDKDDIDALKILKVDLLALGMLTCIQKCLTMLNRPRLVPSTGTPGEDRGEGDFDRRASFYAQNHPHPNPLPEYRERGQELQLHTLPSEDPIVYDMICDADTVGVFQIESRAQMSMLPRLRPREFYDLVIEVAIVRPGPIQGDMVHPYLRRRQGLEKVEFPKPELEAVLGKTLGVPLFQEQAMKLVMVAAGFSADDADRLRRAMASWKFHGQIEQFHQKIVIGMLANGYTEQYAERVFEQIKGFGGYGFPESHSASFALLVYASCWIKRHHPAIFCCGLLNSLPMGFYAPAQLVRDAREHGVEVRPVDVNHSDWDSTLEPVEHPGTVTADKRTWGLAGPAVRLGFDRIKGMREGDATCIVNCRKQGSFTSVEEFHHRTKLQVDAVERLANADAFRSLANTRRPALWNTLALTDEQLPLFADAADTVHAAGVGLPAMPDGQEVMADYATTSLSLKKHPVSLVRDELKRRGVSTAAQLIARRNGWIKVAGLVLIRQRPGTASGIVFITLEDETGSMNLIIKPEIYDQYRAAARHAGLLQADGYVERQGQVVHVMALRMYDLTPMLEGHHFRSRDFH